MFLTVDTGKHNIIITDKNTPAVINPVIEGDNFSFSVKIESLPKYPFVRVKNNENNFEILTVFTGKIFEIKELPSSVDSIKLTGITIDYLSTAKAIIAVEKNLTDVPCVVPRAEDAVDGVIVKNIYGVKTELDRLIEETFGGEKNVVELAKAIETIVSVILSPEVSTAVKTNITGGKTSFALAGDALNAFVKALNEPLARSVINSKGLPETIVISGNIIDSTTKPEDIERVLSLPKSKVEAPVFSPAAGIYKDTMQVTISSATEGAMIYYTIDGMTPSINSTPYEKPIDVVKTTVIKAFAIKTGIKDSPVSSAEYRIKSSAEMVTATPAAGNYDQTIEIMFGGIPVNAKLIYTLDGSVPAADNGAEYSGPIVVFSDIKIKFIVIQPGFDNSEPFEFNYMVRPKLPAPLAEPAAGIFDTSREVALSSSVAEAAVRYTLDGTEPSASKGFDYTAPVVIIKNTTVKAVALKDGFTVSPVTQAEYKIRFNPSDIKPFPEPGEYDKTTEISLTVPAGGRIVYTLNGTEPSVGNGFEYDGPVAVTSRVAFKYIVIMNGYEPSQPVSTQYVIKYKAAVPQFGLKAGIYYYQQSVIITTDTFNADIYYTTDGNDPAGPDAKLYSSPVVISASCTFRAVASKFDMTTSEIAMASYVILYPAPVVATPVFNPAPGAHAAPFNVTITTTTSDASIYYTLDGSAPTKNSTLYAGAINITTAKTIKAIAVKSGYTDSQVVSGDFSPANPVLDAAGSESYDSNGDGYIDKLILKFTKPIDAATINKGVWTLYKSDGVTAVKTDIKDGAGGVAFSAPADDKIQITFTAASLYTAAAKLKYAQSPAGTGVKDSGGNLLEDITTAAALVDKAVPKPSAADIAMIGKIGFSNASGNTVVSSVCNFLSQYGENLITEIYIGANASPNNTPVQDKTAAAATATASYAANDIAINAIAVQIVGHGVWYRLKDDNGNFSIWEQDGVVPDIPAAANLTWSDASSKFLVANANVGVAGQLLRVYRKNVDNSYTFLGRAENGSNGDLSGPYNTGNSYPAETTLNAAVTIYSNASNNTAAYTLVTSESGNESGYADDGAVPAPIAWGATAVALLPNNWAGGGAADEGKVSGANKTAVKLAAGVAINSGEKLKIVVEKTNSVFMTAASSAAAVTPVFGGTTGSITYTGDGNTTTGSLNFTLNGGILSDPEVPVKIAFTNAAGNESGYSNAVNIKYEAPSLTSTNREGAPGDTMGIGQTVKIVTASNGYVHIVPAATAATYADVNTASQVNNTGMKAAVSLESGVYFAKVNLPVTFTSGSYKIYASIGTEISAATAKTLTVKDGSSKPDAIPLYYLEDLNNISGIISQAGFSAFKYYKVLRDLDFTDDASYADKNANKTSWTTGAGWQPISGHPDYADYNCYIDFDGNNKTIKNLMVNREGTAYAGLFGFINSANTADPAFASLAYNITLDSPVVSGKGNSGAFAGEVRNTIITNINVTGTASIKNSQSSNTGGIIGVASHNSSFTNCNFNGSVLHKLTGEFFAMGGIAGVIDNVTITDCTSAGKINDTAAGENDGKLVGGIVGWAKGSSTITGCTNNAAVKGCYSVGGIAGMLESGTLHVVNCINNGSVLSSKTAPAVSSFGGIVGETKSDSNALISGCTNNSAIGQNELSYVGGIAGTNCWKINNCVSTGNITGDDNVGGIAGGNITSNAMVDGDSLSSGTRCSAQGTITGRINVGGIVGSNILGVVKNYEAKHSAITRSSGTSNLVGRICGYNETTLLNNAALSSMKFMPADITDFPRMQGSKTLTGTDGADL